ncbi:hypothetical protein GQE99_04160 [Maritimibacter sp. DP07]|uniref:Uncharacterized protein n=1 Tax=Maritimibacter harenae TaxID=2606218 RepID=A0A845M392_9RHOB|nr:long-chain fatty acid--CoA ligase [Maritimibacter harenae]MZR12207.1 hypothetical protein [Maritimibacter harenae]
MRLRLRSLAALLLMKVPVAAHGGVAEDAVCVRNSSAQPYVFAAEVPGVDRKVARLAPGERLCASGGRPAAMGTVSVFEGLDALEGCSRLVPFGTTEEMKKYVDFDRCFWSSNS